MALVISAALATIQFPLQWPVRSMLKEKEGFSVCNYAASNGLACAKICTHPGNDVGVSGCFMEQPGHRCRKKITLHNRKNKLCGSIKSGICTPGFEGVTCQGLRDFCKSPNNCTGGCSSTMTRAVCVCSTGEYNKDSGECETVPRCAAGSQPTGTNNKFVDVTGNGSDPMDYITEYNPNTDLKGPAKDIYNYTWRQKFSCTECPPGMYKNATSYDKCENCKIGKYALAGWANCTLQTNCTNNTILSVDVTATTVKGLCVNDSTYSDTSCGVGYLCCGDSCSGVNEHSVVVDPTNTTCCKRFIPTIINTEKREPAQGLGTIKKDTLEYALGRQDIILRKMIVIGDAADTKLEENGIRYLPRPYMPISKWARMRTTSDSRCTDELCLPGPCVFLDMAYTGRSAVTAGGEVKTVGNKSVLIDNNQKVFDLFSNNITIGRVTFINGATYCGPLFGQAVLYGDEQFPPASSTPEYVSAFPTAAPVATKYNAATRAGSILPMKTMKTFPVHYYVDGKDGQNIGGELRTDGTPCDQRIIPEILLPRMCTGLSGIDGCTDWQTSGRTSTFTLADSSIANGVFLGFKDRPSASGEGPYNNIHVDKVSFVDDDEPDNPHVRSPDELKQAFAAADPENPGSLNHYVMPPEAIVNRLFLSTRYSTVGNAGPLGFLNHKDAWIGEPSNTICDLGQFAFPTDEGKTSACQVPIPFPYSYYNIEKTDGKKMPTPSPEWADALNKAGFLWLVNAQNKQSFRTTINDKRKPPGQLLDPDCTTTTPLHRFPCHLKGSGYGATIVNMFTPGGMLDEATKDYYHPLFRKRDLAKYPLLLPSGKPYCDYYPDDIDKRGYCDCGAAANYAVSIVAILRAINVLMDSMQSDDTTLPVGHLCDTTETTRCKVPDNVQALACSYKPGDVNTARSPKSTTCSQTEGDSNRCLVDDKGKLNQPTVVVAADDLCDLSVCDIGSTGRANGASDKRIRCMQRGGAIVSTSGTPAMISDNPQDVFADTPTKQVGFIQKWYRSDMILTGGDGPFQVALKGGLRTWTTNTDYTKRLFVTVKRKSGNTKDDTYYGPRKTRKLKDGDRGDWMYVSKGLHFSETDADYSVVSGHSQQAPVRFVPTDRDAGYSQGDAVDSHACNCDNQPIVYRCNFKAQSAIMLGVYQDAPNLTKTLIASNSLQLVECSFSWGYSAHGPDVGMYLPSTSRSVAVIERDVFGPTNATNNSLDVKALIGPDAPTYETARDWLVYNKGTKAETHTTTFTYSCMRYPFGRIHRSQWTDKLRKSIYNDASPFDMETTLIGYCESFVVDSNQRRYVYCPNTRHSAAERKTFCEAPSTSLLAKNILMGYRAVGITLGSSCSDDCKLCLVVPGAALDAGILGSYLSDPKYNGYTILAAPFNASFIARYTIHPKLLPQVASTANPYVMPRSDIPANYKDIDNQTVFKATYGYDHKDVVEIVMLVANTKKYLDAKCHGCSTAMAEKTVAAVVTSFVNAMFPPDALNQLDQKCPSGWWIPDHTEDGIATKLCVPYHHLKEVIVPYTDVETAIMATDLTLRSAYQIGTGPHPIHFKGWPNAARTCERFIISGSGVIIDITADVVGCPFSDGFLITPIKVDGTVVRDVVINVNAVGFQHDTAIVAVIGSDNELYNTPTVLMVNNIRINVLTGPLYQHQFDVALARVGHEDSSTAVPRKDMLVSCSTRCSTSGGTPVSNALALPSQVEQRGCSLLLQGEKSNDLLVMQTQVSSGKSDWVVHWEAQAVLCSETSAGQSPNMPTCTFINITRYTGLFGVGFEETEFAIRRHYAPGAIAACVIMTTLLMGLLSLNIAAVVLADAPAAPALADDLPPRFEPGRAEEVRPMLKW